MQRKHRREEASELKPETTLTVELTLKSPRRSRDQASPPAPRPTPAPAPSEGRIPRLSRLLALAIQFQGLIERGEIRDYAELARLGYVTRARMTQIMNLLNLAPDIQEELLFLVPGKSRGGLTERHLRSLHSVIDWCDQRERWRQLSPAIQLSSTGGHCPHSVSASGSINEADGAVNHGDPRAENGRKPAQKAPGALTR